jgi:hypothetical protein
MSVEGMAHVTSGGKTAILKEGDLLKESDVIDVGAAGHVDLAFDKEWNNVARIGAGTKVAIESVFPAGLKMEKGDIFSKLSKLPKGSTFEIQTPTAIAAVRGTEYWTEYSEGRTSVLNYSPSPVEVFDLDSKGNIQERVVLTEHQKTEVPRLNEPPTPPVKMSDEELRKVGGLDRGLTAAVQEAVAAGREGRAPSVKDLEQKMKDTAEEHPDDDNKKTGNGPGGPGNGDSGSAPENTPASTTPQIGTIQTRAEAAANTVTQKINTQTMLTTTTPPGTAGSNTSPVTKPGSGNSGTVTTTTTTTHGP